MKKSLATDIAYIAMLTAIICVCSQISVPATVPFTLQTFAVFLSVAVLGGRRGSAAVLCYLLPGLMGAAALFGITGGYIAGFLFSALIMWAMEVIAGKSKVVLALSMVLGLAVCYAFGTAWFMAVYAQKQGPIGLGAALLMCVVPYIVPDALKITVALLLGSKLAKHVKPCRRADMAGRKKKTSR